MYSYYKPVQAGDMSIASFIGEAARIGADGVELLDFFYKDPIKERVEAKHALEESGVPCPIFSVAQNFAKKSAEEREKQLDKIKFGVDEALFFGSSVVRVFAGDVADGISFEEAREWIVEGLATASLYAENAGVRLALENHGKLAGRGDQVRKLIEDVRSRSGNEALGANPDTGNFLLVDQPSHEAMKQVAPLAYMVHFKDFAPAPEGAPVGVYESLSGRKVVGTAVGEGIVELESCIDELKAVGYDGWLSVEYEGLEDPILAVPRCLANARRYV